MLSIIYCCLSSKRDSIIDCKRRIFKHNSITDCKTRILLLAAKCVQPIVETCRVRNLLLQLLWQLFFRFCTSNWPCWFKNWERGFYQHVTVPLQKLKHNCQNNSQSKFQRRHVLRNRIQFYLQNFYYWLQNTMKRNSWSMCKNHVFNCICKTRHIS